MKKKTLFLHVGLHKTGTTSIQKNLMDHEQALRLEGYCQPDRLGRPAPGHHRVARLLIDKGPTVFVDHLIEAADLDNIIVSSESFTTLIQLRQFWTAELVDLINKHFDVVPILMLRRQDYMMESVFSQKAKHEHKVSRHAVPNYHYNYLKVVEVLEVSFGRDNLQIVIYRDDKRSDTWKTFCGFLNIDLAAFPPHKSTANQSLHRRKNLALSQIELGNRGMGVATLNAMARSDAIRDDGIKFLFSPTMREDILRKHSESNRVICDRYDISKADADYFCSTEVATDWLPPEEITSDEWAVFVSDVVTRLSKSK